MNTPTIDRTAKSNVVIVGFMLAAILAMALSSAQAGAAGTSGKAVSWGYNSDGQLGNATYNIGSKTSTPVFVTNISGVKSVKAGCFHGLALKNDGTVRAWGNNDLGELGNGNLGTDSDVPVAITNLVNVKNIEGGSEFALAAIE
jgi:alpha-tubulin suppressor-like RCC1 family protein